jgi:ligand-binding SRPBCC domain-containing protein
MQSQQFVRRTRIAASAEELFAWHAAPGALQRLTPPWEPVEVEKEGPVENGAETVLRIRVGPFSLRWVARIIDCIPGRRFRDVQVRGPFASWQHTHRMEPDGASASWLEDRIEYVLPFGWMGRRLGDWLVRRRLDRMFEYRHRITREAFAEDRPRVSPTFAASRP